MSYVYFVYLDRCKAHACVLVGRSFELPTSLLMLIVFPAFDRQEEGPEQDEEFAEHPH